MTDSPTGAALPAPDASAAPASRRSRAGWLWLLVLVLFVAGGYAAWQLRETRRDAQRQQAEWRDVTDALEARIGALDRELEASRERQRVIESRIGENAASGRVVREEVLGIAERAALLEDAVARLAETRERGDLGLRLNEVEFLLQMGEERLRLFADPAAALAAFELAQGALSGLDDPALATLQQTLAMELQALRAAPADPRPALRRRISEVRAGLDALPLAGSSDTATDEQSSRLGQLLSQLVTVRRIDASQTALTPVERASRLTHLRLELGLALAALDSGDLTRWNEALAQAMREFDSLFDAGSPAVVAAREHLQAAREAAALPTPIEVGTTLREIRAIRATRRTGLAAPAPASADAATDVAAEAVEAEQP